MLHFWTKIFEQEHFPLIFDILKFRNDNLRYDLCHDAADNIIIMWPSTDLTFDFNLTLAHQLLQPCKLITRSSW